MPLDPVTFRDHFLSLYQSAVDQAARSQLASNALRPGLENGLVRAAAQVATFKANGTPVPQQPPASFDQDAWMAARLALQLLDARLLPHRAHAAAHRATVARATRRSRHPDRSSPEAVVEQVPR